jgi:NAD(P)-dependent dehydrogenase (short-subunit alcohol dehydrogenase family)
MKALTPLSELIFLKGKKALITGSALGIGKAMAYRFAEAGADLELVDLNERGLRLVARELSGFEVGINTHKVDLSSEEGIAALWKNLKGAEPDILVNNAGIYPFKNFLEVDNAFFSKVLDINFKSTLLMCQHMIRSRLKMRGQSRTRGQSKRGGVIINVGSIEALLPFVEGMASYSMSKAGVIALTRSLAKEYGKNGFRINAIIPGGIITPGTKAVAREVTQLRLGLLRTGMLFSTRLPLRRGGQPDEVARIAVVLASDLSSYVHGALIPVDGGFLSA